MGRLKKIKVSSTQSSSAVKTRIEDNNNASASDNISSTDADPQMQLTPTHSPIRDLVNQFCAEGLSSITTLERLVQMGYKVGEDAPTLSEIYIWRKEFRGDQDEGESVVRHDDSTGVKQNNNENTIANRNKYCELCKKDVSSRRYYEKHMAKSHSIIIGFTKEICDMVDNSSQEYKNKFIYRCDICEGGHDFELFEDFGSHKREAHGIEFKMHSPRTPRHKPIPIKREMFEIEDEEVNNNMGDTPSSSNNRRRSGRAHKPTSFIRDSFETLQIGREGPPVGENGARNSESDVEIDVDGPDNTNSMVFNHFDATNLRSSIELVDFPQLENQTDKTSSLSKKGYLIVPQMLSKSSMNNNITHQQQDTLEVTAEIKPTRKRGRPLGSTGSYKKRVESASKPRTRLSQRLIENVSKVDVTTGLIDDSMADKTMASYSEGRKMMPVPMGIRYDEVLYDILDMQIDFGYISGQLDLKVKNDDGNIVFFARDHEQKCLIFSNDGSNVLVSKIKDDECTSQESWPKSGEVKQFLNAVLGLCYAYFYYEPKKPRSISTCSNSKC